MTTTRASDLAAEHELRPNILTSPGRRIAASFCDALALVIILAVAQVLVDAQYYAVANLGITFGYYAAFLTLNSRTPGQWLFKQITVTSDYRRLTVRTAFVRSAWVLVSYLLFGIPFLTVLFSARKQAVHDMMAKTFVVDSNESGGGPGRSVI